MEGVVAEFEIYAARKTSLVRVRRDEKRPNLGAVKEQMSFPGQRINGQIKPCLKPLGYAVGPFGYAVQGMIGCDASGKVRLVVADGSEIIVKCEI